MISDVSSSKPSNTTYRSLTQIISEVIRKNIYDGVYKPGERLNIVDIAQEFSASAIPVREALRNLEAEGLVDFRPNRGVVIRELSAGEVRELFLMRMPLEALAATQAARRAEPGEMDPLRTILRRMDDLPGTPEWHRLHEQFHRELYALSQMPRLAQFLDVLRGQMRPYAELYLADAQHVAHAQAEHYAMVEAVAAHDRGRVRELVREHLKRPARMALAAFGVSDLPEFDEGAEV